MNIDQVEKYEYCKKHLEKINSWKENLPIKSQQYGCGSGRPPIEYELEKIHKQMHDEIQASLNTAENTIKEIIREI